VDKVHSYIMDWAMNFVKNQDVFTKKIKEIKINDSDFIVMNNDGEETQFIVKLIIDDFEKIIDENRVCIITLNNKNNLVCVINNWEKLIENKFLRIYFVNPFSKLDKKWILYPYSHHKICDESSLELGLKSMFSMVDKINEEQLKIKLGQYCYNLANEACTHWNNQIIIHLI